MMGAELRAGGAIYVAGTGGVSAAEHLQAGASFRSNGPLAMLSSNADLLADAYVVGDVSGSVRVSGTLHVPTTAAVGSDVDASLAREAVSPIAAPCACDSSSADFVDVAGAIAKAMTDNGDSAAGFGPDALLNVLTASRAQARLRDLLPGVDRRHHGPGHPGGARSRASGRSRVA